MVNVGTLCHPVCLPAPTLVTVNCVCPGPTDTPMWRASDPSWNAWKEAQLPIKRVGRPDEIAAEFLFLASEPASTMIGQRVSPNAAAPTGLASPPPPPHFRAI